MKAADLYLSSSAASSSAAAIMILVSSAGLDQDCRDSCDTGDRPFTKHPLHVRVSCVVLAPDGFEVESAVPDDRLVETSVQLQL